VVDAEYAFVIHTASPVTGAADELYAEIVPGLGETLVGAYPGRALGFAWNKAASRADLLAFPSKSAGLFGGGLIFRSDSNAEDLAGYAGAGLYDSVMLAPPREVLLDYAAEPLVWDAAFRQHLLATVAEIGLAVERALGGAQDVEGAYAKGQWHVLQARPQVGAGGA
jgi:alpha-glucan,water dikinase